MIRTILSIAVLTTFIGAAALKGNPSPTRHSSSSKNKKETKAALKVVPAAPLKPGWSLVNGIWNHSDGYKLVDGEVIRVGNQTHKRPPKPPSKTEMDAAKNTRPQTPADAAAKKAAEREKNLTPRPASQTGTHL